MAGSRSATNFLPGVDRMSRLIGTAGHVDHGKTSLIKALTGIDTDRLPEEKRRGLTIDIGFAAIDLPGAGRFSVVDVPGHEKFVANMLVGATGMDVVLLCVAADQGVMPQTVEHFAAIQLLPVERLVVALTRADLADADTREIAALQVAELLDGTRFAGSPTVAVSAVTGEGLDSLRAVLAEAVSEPGKVVAGNWYLPVDRVFSVPGHGTVVTGTLAQGVVEPGSKAVVQPSGKDVRIRAVQVHGDPVSQAESGQRVALNLGGIPFEAVARGMVVGEPGACFATDLFDAEIRWIDRPKHGARLRVSIGADEVIAKVFHNDNDGAIAQFRCERPTAAAKDQPLIIRSYSPPRILGGGKVTVPQAAKRRKNAEVAQRAGLIPTIASFPQGVSADEAARLLGTTVQAIGNEIERAKATGNLAGFGGLWFTPETFAAAETRFFSALDSLHRSNPSRALIPREAAAKQAGLNWAGKPFDRIISHWAAEGKIRADGTAIALASHRPALKERQRALLDRVMALLIAGGAAPPAEHVIAEQLGIPKQAVAEILKVGWEAGELLRVGDGLVFPRRTLEVLAERLRSEFSGNRFTAAEFKERLGISRKYAIPLLEYFDSIGVTMRQGDSRIVLSQ